MRLRISASTLSVSVAVATALCNVVFTTSCGISSGSASTSGSGTPNAYAAAYQKATFAAGVTTTFSSSCSMTIAASGTPYQHQAYYLTPAAGGATVVAATASGIQLAVSPYSGGLANGKAVSATFNICPTKNSATTAAGMGAIGFIFSGTVLFNPYEATLTVANGDNASYTFTQAGTSYTAYFIDPCDQHAAGGMGGSTWHFHGAPNCWTSLVDGAGNVPSHIIGIALDGFPIYGGRDINGAVVDPTTLDACNGITSATPEFPAGAYHYVLPVDSSGNAVKTRQSSINCYSGTVSAQLTASMKKLACTLPMLLVDGNLRLPDGREVTRREADTWLQQAMPAMQMATMPAGNAPRAGARGRPMPAT